MDRSVSGTSRIVVPVNSSRPNNTPMNSNGAQIHAVSPSESGPPIANPMNPAACAAPCGRVRRAGPQVPQPQRRQRDHRRAQHQPWAGLGVRLGAHQQQRHSGGDEGQHPDRRADEDPHHRVDPGADRAGGVEPRTGGDHDRDAQQRQGNAVATMTRIDLAGPAHRPRGATGPLGHHQPSRTHRTARGEAGAGHHTVMAPPGRPTRSLSGPTSRLLSRLRRSRTASRSRL